MQDADETRSRIRAVVEDYLRRRFGKEPTPPPGDPYTHVPAPLRRGCRRDRRRFVSELSSAPVNLPSTTLSSQAQRGIQVLARATSVASKHLDPSLRSG